jgi:isopentenyl-diphosphate delta-isomerase
MDEVVVVNEQDEIIGTMPRQQAHETGVPHRIAVVYVENQKGEILVQIRATGRLDHSSAGHVDPGESYLTAAQRELEEELGIRNAELVSIGKGRSEEIAADLGEHRVHVFEAFKCCAEPGVLHPEEVQGVYWAKPEDILEEMKADTKNKFTQSFKESLAIYLAQRGT